MSSTRDSMGFEDEAGTSLAHRPNLQPNTSGYAVTVVAGPDQGARCVLAPDRPTALLVGKSPVCELRLTDPEVSRRHLSLSLARGSLRITDLGSSNGTLIHGVRVLEAQLEGNELVVLGRSTLQIERLSGEAPHPISHATRFGRLLGGSPEMRGLYAVCERLAKANVPVLVEGETGTGKEVLAESLHEMGSRREGPFVVFDCTAVPPSLLESALFGHERGSFTGATTSRMGVFEEAHGGTLLLDEIGDLDLPLQAKLLRAIERSEVQRVGANRWVRFDVRVLAATRRDLDREVQEGRFRDDLFYRLAVTRVELPPLRSRVGDVGLLARHFWRQIAGESESFPEDFERRMQGYSWPGNVRELHNAIARRFALGDAAPLGTSRVGVDGPISRSPASISKQSLMTDAIEETLALDLPIAAARQRVVDAFERRYVERVLERHGGNVGAAAAASGIARRHFQYIKNRPRD